MADVPETTPPIPAGTADASATPAAVASGRGVSFAGPSARTASRRSSRGKSPASSFSAPPLALAGDGRDERDVIVGGDMAGEHARGGRAQRAIKQKVDHDGVIACEARGLDAIEGRVLGEAKDLDAVREGRGEAFGRVEAAGVELREMDDQGDRRRALAPRELSHLGRELGIAEA